METFAPIFHISNIKNGFSALLFLSFFLIAEKSFSQCSTVPQVDAVINGDFEQGYIGSGPGSFTSDQMYVYDPANAGNSALMDAVLADPAQTGCGGCNLPCAWNSDGRYHITNYFGAFRCDGGNYNGHPFLTEANGRYDHTYGIGGTGRYMWIDTRIAAASNPALGVKLWEQIVDVYPNQMYFFSAWFINLTPASTGANRAQLRFIVEPLDASNNPVAALTQLGSNFMPGETSRQNNWEQFYNTYTTPMTAVRVRLGIYNQSSTLIGNDIGIDDISFVNGCQDILALATPPAPDLGPNINLCTTNGTVTLNSGVATNAGAGRTFTWYSGTTNPQAIIAGPNTTANTLNVNAPGTYRVCVFEPGGCSKSATIVVTQSNTVNLGPDETICNPNSSTVALNATLGTASTFYTYSWTRNGSPIAGTGSTNTATNVGTYIVTATHTSIAACNASDTKIVTSTNSMTTSLGANQNLCGTSTAALTSSLTGTAFTYEWLRNGTVISGATTSSYTATNVGTYTVRLIHPITACNVTANVTITNSNPMTPGHANFCSGGIANLSVSPNATCPYKWYTTIGGTTPIPGTTGSCTYNPTPAGTTTYYVEDTTSTLFTGVGRTGALASPTWDWGNEAINHGLIFSTTKMVVIESVDVWVQEYSNLTNLVVRILDASNNIIGASAVMAYNNTTASPYRLTVPLNITVPIGTNYTMIVAPGSGGGAIRHTAAFGGPFNSPGGGLSITNGTNGRYNFFTDWRIREKTNSCSRLAVTATLEVPCTTPVTFLYFKASKKGSSAMLHWATSSEINSDYYLVERSSDGVHFETIGMVAAAGNSSTVLNYYFSDLNPLEGTSYYRIKEVDKDGTFMFSEVRSMVIDAGFTFTIYPNPGKGLYTLNLNKFTNQTQITVYDLTGKSIFTKSIEAGSSPVIELDIQDKSAAIYYVEVKSDAGVSTQKLIKE